MRLMALLQKRSSEQASSVLQCQEAICRQYDSLVRKLLDEVGQRQWGRSWLGFKRYKIRRKALWWYVIHSDLSGDEWFWVSFGDFDSGGNPLNFEIEAAATRIKTSDLSEASLREALQLAVQKGPARWSPWDR